MRGGGKEPLPAPLRRRIRIFSSERVGKSDAANAVLEVVGVLLANSHEMAFELYNKVAIKRGVPDITPSTEPTSSRESTTGRRSGPFARMRPCTRSSSCPKTFW